MTLLDDGLEQYVNQYAERHRLPGIALAIFRDKQLHQFATGTLNVDTGVGVTPDSIFQIGSITKVMTTCLVMQLVDEGKVDLDTPVQYYLRDYIIADPKASETITVRQLLNHTSGMAGDFFPDDQGHEGNLIARYVDRCNLLPLVHPPGALYSYSNSGFVIAGRLIEVIRGISWHQAMEDYIFKPLGMNRAVADPKELIRYRVAMGHLLSGERWVLSPQPWLPLGMAPCGATPTMSVADLILFARAHLEEGKTLSGQPWLSKASIQAMRNKEIRLPKTSPTTDRFSGLGWALREFYPKGKTLYGHTGATNGFCSSLQICPDKNEAFALLINGLSPVALEAIQNELIKEVFGIEPASEPLIDCSVSPTPNQQLIVGRYESMDKIITVREEGSQLIAHLEYKIDPLPSEDLKLYPITDQCYACETLEGSRRVNWAFVMGNDPESPPVHLFDGGRLNPRI